MLIDVEQTLETVWDALQQWSEDTLGGRTGNGQHETNDSENVEQWENICHAMANITDLLGFDPIAANAEIIEPGKDKVEDLLTELSKLLTTKRPFIYTDSIRQQISNCDAIEVHPVLETAGSCEPIFDDTTPSFWSVYGHLKEGGLECFVDVPTEKEALEYEKKLMNCIQLGNSEKP